MLQLWRLLFPWLSRLFNQPANRRGADGCSACWAASVAELKKRDLGPSAKPVNVSQVSAQPARLRRASKHCQRRSPSIRHSLGYQIALYKGTDEMGDAPLLVSHEF